MSFGPVAVVDVPVHDQHPLEPVHVERAARGDRDVVEQAEAHRARGLGVMARRPRIEIPVRRRPSSEAVDQRDRAARGVQRRLERALG